eukprot:6779-Heterococcus_DN1.PRE.1
MNTTNVVNAYCLSLCTSIATQEVPESIGKDIAMCIDINDSNSAKAAFKDVDARASSLTSTSISARLSSEFITFVDATAASNTSIESNKSNQIANNQAMSSVLQSSASSASANKVLMPTSASTNDNSGKATSSQPRRKSLGSISNNNRALNRSTIVDNSATLRRKSVQYDHSNNIDSSMNGKSLLTSGSLTSTVNADGGDKENSKDSCGGASFMISKGLQVTIPCKAYTEDDTTATGGSHRLDRAGISGTIDDKDIITSVHDSILTDDKDITATASDDIPTHEVTSGAKGHVFEQQVDATTSQKDALESNDDDTLMKAISTKANDVAEESPKTDDIPVKGIAAAAIGSTAAVTSAHSNDTSSAVAAGSTTPVTAREPSFREKLIASGVISDQQSSNRHYMLSSTSMQRQSANKYTSTAARLMGQSSLPYNNQKLPAVPLNSSREHDSNWMLGTHADVTSKSTATAAATAAAYDSSDSALPPAFMAYKGSNDVQKSLSSVSKNMTKSPFMQHSTRLGNAYNASVQQQQQQQQQQPVLSARKYTRNTLYASRPMALREVQYIPMSEKRRKFLVDSIDDNSELRSQTASLQHEQQQQNTQQHGGQQQMTSQAQQSTSSSSTATSGEVSAVNTNTHTSACDNEPNDVSGHSSNVSMLDSIKDTGETHADVDIKGANEVKAVKNGNSEIASNMTDGSANDGTVNGFASDINAAAMGFGGVLHDEVGVNSVGADQNYAFSINTQTYSKASADALAQARAYVAATPKSTKRSKRQQKSEIETDMEHERIMRGMSTAEVFEFLRDKQQEKQQGQPQQQQQQQQQPTTPHHIKASAVNAGFLTSGNGSHLPMVNKIGEHQIPHRQQQQVQRGVYSQQQHLQHQQHQQQQQQQSAVPSGMLYGLPPPDDPMDISPTQSVQDNGVDEDQHIADCNVYEPAGVNNVQPFGDATNNNSCEHSSTSNNATDNSSHRHDRVFSTEGTTIYSKIAQCNTHVAFAARESEARMTHGPFVTAIIKSSARKLVLDPYRWDRVIHKGPMPVSIEEENELYQTTDDDNTNSSSGAAATAAAAAAATPSHLRADNGTPTSSGAKRGRDDTGINGAH